MHIHYNLSLINNDNVFVTVKVTNVDKNILQLTIPNWTDGSYQITNFSKNILRFSDNVSNINNNYLNHYKVLVNDGTVEFNYLINATSEFNKDRLLYASSLQANYFSSSPQSIFIFPTEINDIDEFVDDILIHKIKNKKTKDTFSYSFTHIYNEKYTNNSVFQHNIVYSLNDIYNNYILISSDKNTINECFVIEQFDRKNIFLKNKIEVNHNIYFLADIPNPVIMDLINSNKIEITNKLKTAVEFINKKFGIIFDDYAFYVIFTNNGDFGGIEFNELNVTYFDYEYLDNNIHKDGINKIIKTLIHEYLHAWIVRNNKSKTLEFYNLSKVSNTESLWIYEGIVAYLEKKIMFDVDIISLEEYKTILMQNYSDVYNENGFKQSLISSAINSKNQLYNYNSKSDYYQTNYYKKGMIFWNFIDDNLNYNKITDFYNFVKSNILKNEIIDDKDIVNSLKENLNKKQFDFNIFDELEKQSVSFKIVTNLIKSEINEFNLIKAENEKDTIKLVEINNNGKKSIFVLSVSETNRTSLRYGDKLLKIDNTPIHETNYSLNDLVKIINNFNKTLTEEYKISYQRGNVLFNGI